MTNTKFRKRALLSSVAMLLVALVALGSATFAWFTENPVVTASGISAKGEVSQGLEIQTTSDPGYKKNSANLMKESAKATGAELILSPAYANFTESSGEKTLAGWLSAKAADAAAWGATGNWVAGPSYVEAAASNMALGTGIYHEQVNIKVTSGEASTIKLTGFTMTKTQGAADISDGVTAIVVVDNKIKAMKKLGADAIKTYTSPSTSTSAAGNGSGTWAATTISGNGVELGTAGLGTAQSAALTVDVYVYLDGTDDAVFTNAVSADQLLDSITLTFAK